MTVTLKEMMASLSAKEREAVDARATELIAEEMTLRDLRNALALTQKTVAKSLVFFPAQIMLRKAYDLDSICFTDHNKT